MSADNKKTCFVIFPFENPYKGFFKKIYKPALESVGLTVEIAGTPGTNKITDDIEKKIKESFICLADVTGDNSNVWYEVGYAYGCGKQVILVCNEVVRKFDKLPFDIQHKNIIGYSVVDADTRAKCQREIIADAKAKMDIEKTERESVPDYDIPKDIMLEDIRVLAMIIRQSAHGTLAIDMTAHQLSSIIKLKRHQYITTEKKEYKRSDNSFEIKLIYFPTEDAIKLKKKHLDLFLPRPF